MRHSTFRQLEVFEAIARLGSYTRAAEELFLTQPTVSIQIKKLTDTVGLPLFEQIGKRIYVTDAGKALQLTCGEIFKSLNNFEMLTADLRGLKKGKLQLAVVTTAKYFAPRLLGPFCKLYPGIEVSLKVCNRERLLERLNENKDDLYILGQPPESLEIEYEPFLDNPLVVLAPADHPLVGKKNISLDRIASEPFIMREPGSGTRIAVERLFHEHNHKLNVRMDIGSNEAIKQAIVGGLGISILSRHTLALDAAMGQIAILNVEHFPIKRQWYVANLTGKQPTIVAQTFLEYLRSSADQISDVPCRLAERAGACPLSDISSKEK
ncbi:MAG: LysR substrate-binding domain-containing protein [Gammaproteobacteria bacterium]|nr:LysR substrate-binding domain-containing protein [Gammaproteobacteria bacterium]MDX2486612.1 LysR substrate-binding domain-containing protein [Gammaproteobacteria bacterium]